MEPGVDRRQAASTRLKVVVTEGLSGPHVDRLAEHAVIERCDHRPEVLYERAFDADALLVQTMTQVDRALLDHCPQLRAVARAGIGLDNFDLDACAERGIQVFNSAGQNAIAVAEMTFYAMLSLARGSSLDPDRLDAWDRAGATGVELHSRTLGIIGFGAIGRQVAVRAQAFGLQVLGNDPYVSDDTWGSVTPTSLPDLLSRSEIVSLHLPATSETRGMVDAGFLAEMKPGAWIINTARGSIIDEEALVTALDSGHLGGAALDVRQTEPPPQPDPLRGRRNVLLSPHVAGFTRVSLDRVLRAACEQLGASLRTLQAARSSVLADSY